MSDSPQNSQTPEIKSTDKKPLISKRALIIIAIIAVPVLIGMLLEKTELNAVEGADKLWNSGNKTEAIAKYKDIIQNTSLTDRQKTPLYIRIIENAFEQGNSAEAKKYLSEACDKNLELPLSNPKMRAFINEYKAGKFKYLPFTLADAKMDLQDIIESDNISVTSKGATIHDLTMSEKRHLYVEEYNGRAIEYSLSQKVESKIDFLATLGFFKGEMKRLIGRDIDSIPDFRAKLKIDPEDMYPFGTDLFSHDGFTYFRSTEGDDWVKLSVRKD